MKGVKQHRGYTIVEVMIVLAVSGVMFIIAANAVSGKQAKTAFNQGVNTLVADIQSSLEAVSDGQYSDIPLTCTLQAAPRKLTFASGSARGQGTNQDCTFFGQLLHFDVNDPTHGADTHNNYEVLYLAAAKNSSTNGPLLALNDSALTAITSNNGSIDLTRYQGLPQGLDIEGMKVFFSGGPTTSGVYDIGFVQGLGAVSATSTASYASGSQLISLIADPSVTAGLAPTSAANVNQGSVQTATEAIICLTDGTRHASITIGDNGNQLKATAQLGSNVQAC